MKKLCFILLTLLLASRLPAQNAPEGAAPWSPPTSLESLPVVAGLPDVFTFADGDRVETHDDWTRRRQELQALLRYYQYGSMPPRPDRVRVVESSRHPHSSGLGTVESLTLEIDSVKQLRFRAVLYLPRHAGRRPVIIREEGTLGQRKEAPLFLEKGYIFIEYARHDLDPDRNGVIGAAQAAYPDHDWATLAVWAWCGMRLVDYLETRSDIDLSRIGITGHSRGGKMALLAAALDERFSLVVPHQSGAGGAGCYRALGPGAETLAQNDKPHWYHERIRRFGEKEERLPLDQHFLKALVAPRALLCTESLDDEFANPLGCLVTSAAAQEVFTFLGAPTRNGIHFRRGSHSTRTEDWARLLEFAEWQFFGRAPADPNRFWHAPFALPPGYDAWRMGRPFTRPPNTGEAQPLIPPADSEQEAAFVQVGFPQNPSDRDHHRQGCFGAVAQVFEMAVRQVTHLEYARFLNAVAARDPGELYHAAMATGPGAIQRVETDVGYRYRVREGELAIPVTHVSWFDAARYCNWLHHGRPVGPQGADTTESGAYVLRESGLERQRDARFFLPTEHEWYKAAYYRPSPEGGSYQLFAAGKTDRPLIDSVRPDLVSPLGMAEFADAIWEWTETPVGTLHRGLRSGAWFLGNNRQAAGRFYSNPRLEVPNIGIRVARASDRPGELAFQSSSKDLNDRFQWAKRRALSYAHDRDPVGPWYEAALPGREAFCMRDVAHQALGAHVLGLQRHNLNMLGKFAANISESKDWCSFWEINRHDLPAPVDYTSDKEFWYNLPANFDVLDACYRQYLWTHDETYLHGDDFVRFYRRSLSDYAQRWDLGLDRMFSRERFMNRASYDRNKSHQFCRGIPSYHEGDPGRTRLGIDLVALHGAALKAHARLLKLRGHRLASQDFMDQARAYSRALETSFWDSTDRRFYDLYLTDDSYRVEGYMYVFALYAGAVQSPDKIDQTIQTMIADPRPNIEMESYYPEVLYRYGAHEQARAEILRLTDPGMKRRDYPEVSFAVVGAMAAGLMGIEPGAADGAVATLSRLTAEEIWAEMRSVPVHDRTIDVRHTGNTASVLRNRSDQSITWTARFYGAATVLTVDGEEMAAEQAADAAGDVFAHVQVTVGPHESRSVRVEK